MTVRRKSLAEVIRTSDRLNWDKAADSESVKSGGSGRPTSGVKATATAANDTSSQASGPRKPSRNATFASVANLGATSRRPAQAASVRSKVNRAAKPSIQTGGSGISQRSAAANRGGMGRLRE